MNPLFFARQELAKHVREIPGPGNNPDIVKYHASTRGPRGRDEIAWCSSFTNWCVTQAGLVGTNRRLARSWLKWGNAAEPPSEGDIVVFWRGSPKLITGHVGFYIGEAGQGRILVLGGNQGNSVSIKVFPKSRVLGYRRAA